MKCKRLTIFSGLLLSLFFSFSLSSDTFAIDDISVIIDSSSSFNRGDPVFPDCDSSCFSQYSYFKVDVLSSVLYSSSDIRFILVTPGYSNKQIFLPSFTSSYVALSSDISNILFYSISVTSEFSYRLSLSDSLPGSSCPEPEVPTGNLDIIENGQYDVTNYATATVNVPQESSETPYDNKFDQIIQAIYVCAGTMLVIYFFYCIYRMIIKGVKQ